MSSNESSLQKKKQAIAHKREIEKEKKEKNLLQLQNNKVSLYELQLQKKREDIALKRKMEKERKEKYRLDLKNYKR